jgi:hypothetical protein
MVRASIGSRSAGVNKSRNKHSRREILDAATAAVYNRTTDLFRGCG